MPTPADAFREGLQLGPLGIPLTVTSQDPTGEGDRSSLFGDTVYVPSKDAASVPHEAMHANLRRVEWVVPGSVLAEGLLSRLAESAYGDKSQYLNPFERVAYGYQEGYTGQPDKQYQKAVADRPSGLIATPGNAVGSIADTLGRLLGKMQRPKK